MKNRLLHNSNQTYLYTHGLGLGSTFQIFRQGRLFLVSSSTTTTTLSTNSICYATTGNKK